MQLGDRKTLLRRLNPGDQSATQQRLLSNARIPGVAQWFFDHEKTQDWLSGSDGRVLWLDGPSISPTSNTSSCPADKTQAQLARLLLPRVL